MQRELSASEGDYVASWIGTADSVLGTLQVDASYRSKRYSIGSIWNNTWEVIKAGAQGYLDFEKGLQHVVVGLLNLPGNLADLATFGHIQIPQIPDAEWSRDAITSEPDWVHNAAEFAGQVAGNALLFALTDALENVPQYRGLTNLGSRVGPEFDPEKLERIIAAFEAQGGTVIRGETALGVLRANNANALYFPVEGGPGVLFLGSNPTRLEVTEELIHLGQFRTAGWPTTAGNPLIRNAFEVQAQEKLLQLAQQQGWTMEEIAKILENRDFWLSQ